MLNNEIKMNEEIKEIVHKNRPYYSWVKFAAFDEGDGRTRKLCFYEYKPELRSSYWFSSKGYTHSMHVVVNCQYDWKQTLIELPLTLNDLKNIEKQEEINKLTHRINELEELTREAKVKLMRLRREK